MKLYKHPVLGSESLTETEISQICYEVFDNCRENICNALQNHVNRTFSMFISKYTNLSDYERRVNQAIDPNNLYVDSHIIKTFNAIAINVYILFPVYLLCEYFFASGFSSSRIANEHSDDFYDFCISSNYQTLNTYVEAYSVRHNLDTSKTKLISSFEDSFTRYINSITADVTLLADPERFRSKSVPSDDSLYDSSEVKKICNKFIKYCESNYKRSRKSKWMRILDNLESEMHEGINSIYEQTESGNYIDRIAQQVEEKLGVYAEPSTQGGQGIMEFRNADNHDILLRKDYEEFCEDIITIALHSESKNDFISGLKQYYYAIYEDSDIFNR